MVRKDTVKYSTEAVNNKGSIWSHGE